MALKKHPRRVLKGGTQRMPPNHPRKFQSVELKTLLFKPAFLFFLITHIHAYHFFIHTYGVNTISPSTPIIILAMAENMCYIIKPTQTINTLYGEDC